MPSIQQQFSSLYGRLIPLTEQSYDMATGPYTLNNQSGETYPEVAEFMLVQSQGGSTRLSFTGELGPDSHIVVDNETIQYYGQIQGIEFGADADTPAETVTITFFRYATPDILRLE